ncbi:WhiB family transcriptional regulator [Streptomyces luteolifulvus]|uniref:Transcriptional regulator WhiB n=1 Tax=Streptomyces luteolifulvus TaxID=2615112 RepID=A0A6H9V1I6_9ACTN|nr:WhiB family transcriptional regulator [Streptomyces luteolifulvus]
MTGTSSNRDWRATAACLDEDPELFFPNGTSGPWLIQIEDAKAVCRRCPVVEACLQYALQGRIPEGIFGGLTGDERASLNRSVRRGRTTPQQAEDKAATARQPRRENPLQDLFDNNTVRLFGGHLAWIGPTQAWHQNRPYTPKKLAFILARGREPEGRVLVDCGNRKCVLPAHVADDAERMQCGTRPGYRRHQRQGTEVCEPCREANADAERQRTGTTRAVA